MKGRTRAWARLAAMLAAGLLAIGAAACGSNDNDGSGGPPGGGTANASDDADTPATGRGASDKEQIKAVYAKLVDAVYDQDGKAACALLTKQTQKAMQRSTRTPCVKRMTNLGAQVVDTPPRIYSLKVNDTRAVARTGTPDSARYPVPFTKVDGKWMISGGF